MVGPSPITFVWSLRQGEEEMTVGRPALKASLGNDSHLSHTLSWPEPITWPCPVSEERGRESPSVCKRRAGFLTPPRTRAHQGPQYLPTLYTQPAHPCSWWSCTQHLSAPPCPPPRAGQGCGPAESSCRWSFSGVEGVQPCLLQGSLLHHTAARALSQPG